MVETLVWFGEAAGNTGEWRGGVGVNDVRLTSLTPRCPHDFRSAIGDSAPLAE